MTYDESDDYNGPDTHRRGPFLFMAAIVGVILVAGGVAAASEVRADPNVQTQLPSNGVLSIDRIGDVWSVTTDGIPSEVKIMSPRNEVLCGVNYGIPCTTVTTFTSAGECVYLQLDGIPGFNSSDPFLCIGGTPSSTPVATEPASPSPTPTATTDPSPLPTPTDSPTSTPEPSSSPNSTPIPSLSTTPNPSSPLTDASTGSPTHTTSSSDVAQVSPAPARLADTGRPLTFWDFTAVMFATTLIGVGTIALVRRTNP